METPTDLTTIITTDVIAFICGGGALKLLSTYWKKKDKDAQNISDLGTTFRMSLEARLDKLEKDNEDKEKQILILSTKLAKFETENKILKMQIKEIERSKQ